MNLNNNAGIDEEFELFKILTETLVYFKTDTLPEFQKIIDNSFEDFQKVVLSNLLFLDTKLKIEYLVRLINKFKNINSSSYASDSICNFILEKLNLSKQDIIFFYSRILTKYDWNENSEGVIICKAKTFDSSNIENFIIRLDNIFLSETQFLEVLNKIWNFIKMEKIPNYFPYEDLNYVQKLYNFKYIFCNNYQLSTIEKTLKFLDENLINQSRKTEQKSPDIKCSFGFKYKEDKILRNIYKGLQLHINHFLNEKLTDENAFVNLFIASDMNIIKEEIHLECDIPQFYYIVNKLQPLFRNKLISLIDKSQKFFSKKGKVITAAHISKAGSTSPNPKEMEKIDKVFKDLQ